jgi:hypothetical protein
LSITTVGITPAGGPAAFANLKPTTTDLHESVEWTTPASVEVDGTAQMLGAAKDAVYCDAANNVDFVAGSVTGLTLVKAL